MCMVTDYRDVWFCRSELASLPNSLMLSHLKFERVLCTNHSSLLGWLYPCLEFKSLYPSGKVLAANLYILKTIKDFLISWHSRKQNTIILSNKKGRIYIAMSSEISEIEFVPIGVSSGKVISALWSQCWINLYNTPSYRKNYI